MTKQSVETPEIEVLGDVAVSRTEKFLAENGRKVVIAIAGAVAVAVAIFGYKALVLDPAEQSAAEAIYAAQGLLDGASPDYQQALDGTADFAGFVEVYENFGSTASGNLAAHYAGVCYLKLGDYTSAAKYLKAYKPQKSIPAQIVNAQNIGLQGDIAVELGDYPAAVALFKQASAASDNIITAPMYLRKAGQAAQAAGDNADAIALYESVVELYPAATEARSAAKLLGTIK
ncbi:MAG: tetratricopeptide repeat protein [Rikenellaceae bacterium]